MATLDSYTLFTPLELAKGLTLKNRIVYGPATRARADLKTRVPLDRMFTYYEQRAAGAGLIIAEACAVSEQAFGWWGSPALYNDEQEAAWKILVDRVHAKGGTIFLQLWHLGRNSHPSFHVKGEVVSASASKLSGTIRNSDGEHEPYVRARALELDEIADVVDDYRKCAKRAKAVGFDGVEVHGASGCLVDQFLQSSTNWRTDKYGGSFENRSRFLHEIVEALKTVYPADRIAVRLSPNGSAAEMGSEDNFEMFTYAIERLGAHGLAYLALLDGVLFADSDKSRHLSVFDAKKVFKGIVMSNNMLTRDVAEGLLRSGAADLVGFVRLYMANPDLAERFRNDWPLNTQEVPYEHFWDAHKGDEGYNSFPIYAESVSAGPAAP